MKSPARAKIVPSEGIEWSAALTHLVERVNLAPEKITNRDWSSFYARLKKEDPDAYAKRELETQRRRAIGATRFLSIIDLENILDERRAEARRDLLSRPESDQPRTAPTKE